MEAVVGEVVRRGDGSGEEAPAERGVGDEADAEVAQGVEDAVVLDAALEEA